MRDYQPASHAWQSLEKNQILKGKSKAELAEKLGITPQTLNKWFQGIGTPIWIELKEVHEVIAEKK